MADSSDRPDRRPMPAPSPSSLTARVFYRSAVAGRAAVRRRLVIAGGMLVGVCLVGVVGYWWLGSGHWSWADCLYMVLITITTVGYAEVFPLSEVPHARGFTMALLVAGVGVSLYFLSALTAFIIEGDLSEVLWRRRMNKRLDALKDHVIVCGAGRTGQQVVSELHKASVPLVVVERDHEVLSRLMELFPDTLAIEADATEDAVLLGAGIERARGLVTTLHSDQDNLFVALSARQVASKVRIVSRANAERAGPKLLQAGADAVVSPTHIGGRRLAHELLRPNLIGFLDFIARDDRLNYDIVEISIPPRSPLAGRTLAKSRIREVSNALVLAVVDGEQSRFNPGPETRLESGHRILVLGERPALDRLQDYVGGRTPSPPFGPAG